MVWQGIILEDGGKAEGREGEGGGGRGREGEGARERKNEEGEAEGWKGEKERKGGSRTTITEQGVKFLTEYHKQLIY